MELNDRHKISILRALRDSHMPMGSGRIARDIEAYGIELNPRTIRGYLEKLETAGLVTPSSRGRGGGRMITERGIEEIENASVFDRVGLTAVKVDTLAWRTRFNHTTREGQVVLNLSTIESRHLPAAIKCMLPVFEAGYSMGEYVGIFRTGDKVGSLDVPRGKVMIGTVCSVTINGILLSHRIHAVSRFGGVLELSDGRPSRFTEVIYYDGTSLDPLEIFIKGALTRVTDAVSGGTGRIGASFREIPTLALDEAHQILDELEEMGLGGALMLGKPNQPLLGFPVPEGRTGLIVNGGLNPLAAVQEFGIQTHNVALSQLFDFDRLSHYSALDRYI